MPAGTVQFKDNGNNLGAPVVANLAGVAQVSTSTLTVGTHTITADFSGDGNYAASTGTLPSSSQMKQMNADGTFCRTRSTCVRT